MCNAFSCIVSRTRKVYWRLGLDSHEDIRDKFKVKDKDNFCPVEITPNNKDYVNPDRWNFKFDDTCPDWWKQSHEQAAWEAHKLWLKELDKKLKRRRLRNLIHPFNDMPMVKKVTEEHIKLLREWASVRASVRDSVGASVWDSVRASVRDSVGASVWDSVRASVRDSIGASVEDSVRASVRASVRDSVWDFFYAYHGSMFKLKRSEWKYTKTIKCRGYLFSSAVKLWEQGLVPSFDGKIWRLHSGKKAKVVFKISKEKLIGD